jgi:ADP-ribose pyrophosphatase
VFPRVLKSQTLFQGRTLSLRLEQVELKPGLSTAIEVVDHVGAVTVLPVDEAGNIWFVRQYRHPVRQWLLELPAGTLRAGEDPLEGAGRELQEEIGMRAGRMEPLLTFWLAPGYSSEFMRIYLAGELSPSALPQDEDEMITVEKVPAAQAVAMALDGRLDDAKSIVAILAAARRLGW